MGAVADVQTRIEAQGLIGGSTDWASVRRRVTDTQDRIVVMTEDGGPIPEVGTSGSVAIVTEGVQVLVRARPWNGDEAQTKAQAIYDDLHSLVGTIGATTYIGCRAMSPPVFIGFDERGRPQFTTAYRLQRGA